MNHNPTPAPPITIENTSFIRLLGDGSSATVWLAESKLHKDKQVIKIFRKSFLEDDEKFRFHRECKFLSALSHKNIVRVIKWGITDQTPWIIFEYVDAVTLNDYMADKVNLTFQDKLTIISEICEGIAYSHSNNVLHRDLKPGNILITAQQTPIIIDFGLAKSSLCNTVQTATGIVTGTPAYMAP